MNTLTAPPEDDLDDPAAGQLPGRPRHKLLNRMTATLLAVLLAAAGFLVGIEVEKGRAGGTSTTARTGGLASRAGGFAPGGFGGARGSGARTGSAGGASRFSGAPGGGFAGVASAGATTGTISSISGRTIYLKTTSGNTIKVTLTSATSLKKDLSVKRNSIRPGDSITVAGITGSGGSIKASSVSDSGDASASTSSTASGAS